MNSLNDNHDPHLSSEQTLQDMQVPVIDLSLLHKNSETRALVIKEIHEACRNKGFFHVINHGISEALIEESFNVNANFFELPLAMKEEHTSDDIYKPVRFNRVKSGADGSTRDFLKLYAHPLEEFFVSWPKTPHDYREKMGMYTVEARKLGIEVLEAIMESLKLGATSEILKESIEQGIQMVAVNCYPPLTESPNTNIGVAPHTDHSIITILQQNSPGLQVMDRTDGAWKCVPELKGSLQVLVGIHLEVLSNGRYHAVLHRVIHSSSTKTRLSVASLHSLRMNDIVEPAKELVDEEHPKLYRESSLGDFLRHMASGKSKPFIDTIKIHPQKE